MLLTLFFTPSLLLFTFPFLFLFFILVPQHFSLFPLDLQSHFPTNISKRFWQKRVTPVQEGRQVDYLSIIASRWNASLEGYLLLLCSPSSHLVLPCKRNCPLQKNNLGLCKQLKMTYTLTVSAKAANSVMFFVAQSKVTEKKLRRWMIKLSVWLNIGILQPWPPSFFNQVVSLA